MKKRRTFWPAWTRPSSNQNAPAKGEAAHWLRSFLDRRYSNVSREMCIRRNRAQPQVLDWTADGEMIETLPIVAGQTERAVQHIIEVATNAGATNTGSLGSQIQCLADHSSFPKQFPVSRRAALPQDWL